MIEPHRQVRRKLRQGRDCLMQNVIVNRGFAFSFEQTVAGGDFIKNYTQTEDIGAMIQRLSHRLLGRHVLDCAHDTARLRSIGMSMRAHELGQTEVEHFNINRRCAT